MSLASYNSIDTEPQVAAWGIGTVTPRTMIKDLVAAKAHSTNRISIHKMTQGQVASVRGHIMTINEMKISAMAVSPTTINKTARVPVSAKTLDKGGTHRVRISSIHHSKPNKLNSRTMAINHIKMRSSMDSPGGSNLRCKVEMHQTTTQGTSTSKTISSSNSGNSLSNNGKELIHSIMRGNLKGSRDRSSSSSNPSRISTTTGSNRLGIRDETEYLLKIPSMLINPLKR